MVPGANGDHNLKKTKTFGFGPGFCVLLSSVPSTGCPFTLAFSHPSPLARPLNPKPLLPIHPPKIPRLLWSLADTLLFVQSLGDLEENTKSLEFCGLDTKFDSAT